MNKEKALETVKSLQAAVEQMKIDDLEESPEAALETFQCFCCGEEKEMAGALPYGENLLCNDCVLLAETSFALGKIKRIEELIELMEDKRLEVNCNFIINDMQNKNDENN